MGAVTGRARNGAPRRPATVRDVAAAADVSIAVASVVLRDALDTQSTIRVGAATRDRVRRAAQRLGYTPNAAARALRTGRTQTVGVVVRQLSHPFFSAIVDGIEAACRAAGYHLLLGDVFSDEREEQALVGLLSQGRADGLLVLGELPDDERVIRAALEVGTPTVLVARQSVGGAAAVALDHLRAVTLALDHLRELRHRAVAFAVPAESRRMPAFRTRLSAAETYAAAHGWDPPRTLEVAPQDGTELVELVADLRTARPAVTAVLGSDRVAVRILKAAQRAGIGVPGNLSIVALDGTELTRHTTPELTAVTQPLREMGRLATEQLLALLSGQPGTENPTILLQPELIVRESTGPASAAG